MSATFTRAGAALESVAAIIAAGVVSATLEFIDAATLRMIEDDVPAACRWTQRRCCSSRWTGRRDWSRARGGFRDPFGHSWSVGDRSPLEPHETT